MGIGITAQKYGSQGLQEARVMMMFCGYSIRAQKVNSNKLMLSVNAEVTPILPDLVFLLFGTSYVCWMYVSVCVCDVYFLFMIQHASQVILKNVTSMLIYMHSPYFMFIGYPNKTEYGAVRIVFVCVFVFL